MSAKPKTYTDQIAKNSNAAECVRQADETLTNLADELETLSQVLQNPFDSSVHLLRCMRLNHEAQMKLYQTGIPTYRQDTLFTVKNPGALK